MFLGWLNANAEAMIAARRELIRVNYKARHIYPLAYTAALRHIGYLRDFRKGLEHYAATHPRRLTDDWQ